MLVLGLAIETAQHTYADDATRVLLVGGAGGEPKYADSIQTSLEAWMGLWERRANVQVVGPHLPQEDAATESDFERCRRWFAALEPSADTALESPPTSMEAWVVLIGHATAHEQEIKFNLRGPDVSTAELADWMKQADQRCPQLRWRIVIAASSSGAFLKPLAGPNRIVVVSTKSGREHHWSRFGEALARRLTDRSADLDHNGELSLLEAFLAASRDTQRYYEEAGQLATEHALIDDNGDGVGTPAEFFTGTRVTGRARSDQPIDGKAGQRTSLSASVSPLARRSPLTAEERDHRERLLEAIDSLRSSKGQLDAEAYHDQLQAMLLELADLLLEPQANGSATAAE